LKINTILLNDYFAKIIQTLLFNAAARKQKNEISRELRDFRYSVPQQVSNKKCPSENLPSLQNENLSFHPFFSFIVSNNILAYVTPLTDSQLTSSHGLCQWPRLQLRNIVYNLFFIVSSRSRFVLNKIHAAL